MKTTIWLALILMGIGVGIAEFLTIYAYVVSTEDPSLWPFAWGVYITAVITIMFCLVNGYLAIVGSVEAATENRGT